MNKFLCAMITVLAFLFYLFSLCIAILYWAGKEIYDRFVILLDGDRC